MEHSYLQKILVINSIIALFSALSNLWSVNVDDSKKLGLIYYCEYNTCTKYNDKDISFDLKLIYAFLCLSNIFMILALSKDFINKQYLAASILCGLCVILIWLISNDVGYTYECLTNPSTCCQCINKNAFYTYFTTTVVSLLVLNNI